MRQGGDYSSYTVASEYLDPEGFTGPPCRFNKVCRYSDASLFIYWFSYDSYDGKVAYPSITGSTSFTTHKDITWVDTPYSGMAVHAIGANSGRRVGTLSYTCINVYGTNGFGNKDVLCQNYAAYAGALGDSGGPVIALYGDGSVSALGQHWGSTTGGSYFSAVYMILNEFYSASNSWLYLSPVVY